MKNLSKGIFLAILAAALYAINSPFAKILLDYMPSTLMAGFLYVGAGLGMLIIALIRKLRDTEKKELKLTFFIAFILMGIGAFLCSKDEPLFKKK